MFRPISFDSIQKQASSDTQHNANNQVKILKPIAKTALPPFSFNPDSSKIVSNSESPHVPVELSHSLPISTSTLFQCDSLQTLDTQPPSNSEYQSHHSRENNAWPHNQSFPSERYDINAAERDIRRFKQNKAKSAYSALDKDNQIITSLKPPSFRKKPSSAISEASIQPISVSECPTITSIHTVSSHASSHDSDFPKPLTHQPTPSQELNEPADQNDTPRVTKQAPTTVAFTRQLSADSDRSGNGQELRHSHGNKLREYVTSRRGKKSSQTDIQNRNVSSSSSSLTEHDDKTGSSKKLSHRLNSGEGGVRRSLRLFERKTDDYEGGDDSNPWFQQRLPSIDEGPEKEPANAAKELMSKKKRLKKIGLKFLKDTKDRTVGKDLSSGDSSSSDPNFNSNAGSDDGTSVGAETQHDYESDICYDDNDLQKAISENKTLIEVLEIAVKLKDRPSEEVANHLYKFLATAPTLQLAIEIVLGHTPPDVELDSTRPLSRNRNDSYREVLVYFFVTGPRKLRKAILTNTKARWLLFSSFVEEAEFGPVKPKKLELDSFRTHCTARILNSLLSDNTAEVTEYLASKKGLLHTIVRNHIHVPEVISFVCRLCVGDALADAPGDEYRYGAPNVPGIILLANEGICNLLVHMFTEASSPNGSVSYEDLRCYTQVMSMGCLLELSKRCTVVPQYSKANCSYSSKTIKAVNSALININSFQNRNRVELLLECGVNSVITDNKPCTAEEILLGNNAAVYALSFACDLMTMVRQAGESKSVATRRTIGAVRVTEIEQAILSQIETMMKLLCIRSSRVLGRLKTAIVKTLVGLFASSLSDTGVELVKHKVPETLLRTLKANRGSSILHKHIVECMGMSLKRKDAVKLHAAWFNGLQITGGVLEDLEQVLEGGHMMNNNVEWHCYRSTLLDMGFMIYELSQHLTRGEFHRLFQSDEKYMKWTSKIEQDLAKVEKEGQGACGGPKPEGAIVSMLANAESLAALLDDVNAV